MKETNYNYDKKRFETFIDAVIAIILTILVLELKIPEGYTIEALKPLLHTLVSYVLSFIYIGIYWNNHHHLFQSVKQIKGNVLWHNMHLLFWLTHLIPSFVSYIGSFLLITGIWIDHHLLFLNLNKLTRKYILLNMLFVLSLSVVPFTTAFAGHHYLDSFAVALLFVNYVIMNILFGALYWHANWYKLLPSKYFSLRSHWPMYIRICLLGWEY